MNDMHEYDLLQDSWVKLNYKTQCCILPPMTGHISAGSENMMYIYYEGRLYRLDINTYTWNKFKSCLRAPKLMNSGCMHVIDNYLYLFGDNAEGAGLYRLNLEKVSIMDSSDMTPDYSAYLNHEPTADVLIKVLDTHILAHRELLCKYSGLLKKQLTKGIKTITISEFSGNTIQDLIEQLYRDCNKDLPRDNNSLLQLYKAANWLEISELAGRCDNAIVVSASNLRLTYEILGDIQSVFTKIQAYVKTHLKESALLLAPQQLSAILSE